MSHHPSSKSAAAAVHDDHDVSKHVKTYLLIGLFLLIGTGLTVWAATIHFGSHSMNIAIGLLIATVKASLVALFFMHLISEKTAIYMFLSVTVFFFAGLMVLTLWASHDLPLDSEHLRLKPPAAAAAAHH
jgi:cytochrome c oxidase subunit 4